MLLLRLGYLQVVANKMLLIRFTTPTKHYIKLKMKVVIKWLLDLKIQKHKFYQVTNPLF